jgi:MFS family permease
MSTDAFFAQGNASPSRTNRREALFLNGLHVVIDGLTDTVPVLLVFVVASFGSGVMAAGGIVSMSNAAHTLCGLATLVALRALGYAGALGGAVLLYGCSFFLSAFATNLAALGALLVIGAAGVSVFHSAAFSYLVLRSERGSRGKAMGDFAAIGDIGRIPLASMAALLASIPFWQIPGWRLVFFVYGLLGISCALIVLGSRQAFRSSSEHLDRPESRRKTIDIRPLGQKQHLLPVVSGMLDAFGSNQVFVFLPFLLISKGVDPKFVGAAVFAFTVGSFVGKSILGRFVDAWGARRTFLFCELVLACSIAAAVATDHEVALLVVAFFLGAGSKGTVPIVQAIVTEPFTRERDCQNIVSIMTFVRGAASIVSPIVFAATIAALGISWSFWLMAAIAILAAVPIVLVSPKVTNCQVRD